MSRPPDKRMRGAATLAALVLAYAAVSLGFALHARPNIDEGMFLWAGRLVADGQWPYRDFPFAQAPLLPYAFSAAPEWLGSALRGGRLVAWAAGVLGAAGALWLARRVAGDFAALVTALVVLATPPLLYVGATVRAQAIATPLLVLGVAALALPRTRSWHWALAPALLVASTGLRLTNAPLLVALLLWTAWQLRAQPARLARVAALVAVAAFVALAPALRAPREAWFQVVEAQLGRDARFGYVHAPALAERVGAYLDLLPDAAPLLLLALPLAALWAWRARGGGGARLAPATPFRDAASAQAALGACALVAFAPHLALGNAFLEYLVPLWALLAPAVGIGVAAELRRRGVGREGKAAVALVLAALAVGHGVRSAEVWIGRGPASFAAFHATAAGLGRAGGPGCTMLSFETELVVESGCRVLPGLEYSFFSYFAELPRDEARRRGVANLEMLRERAAEARPALVVLAPGHAQLMLGPNLAAGAGAPRPREPGSLHPLEFLGPLAAHYTPRERVSIPSGIRRPPGRDRVPMLVFERREPSR